MTQIAKIFGLGVIINVVVKLGRILITLPFWVF